MAVVEAKVSDQPLHRAAPEQPSKVTDLMAALKASVEAAQKGERDTRSGEGKQVTAARRRATGDGERRRKAS
jgi:non-homologous end joining protein Ku